MNKTSNILNISPKDTAPDNLEIITTITDSLFTKNYYNNRACIFLSVQDDKIYVAYGIKSVTFNLEFYDYESDEKYTAIKSIHKNNFDSIRYYKDNVDKRDLLITASLDSHVKVVRFKRGDMKVILDLNFEDLEQRPIINTALIMHETVLVPFSSSLKGTVKFYSLKEGEFIRKTEENAGFILGLSTYFSEAKKMHFILVGNSVGFFVYLIEDDLSLYNKFIPDQKVKNNGFDEAYVIENVKKMILVGPCFYYGFMYFWDLEKGDLLYTMKFSSGISDICLWSSRYILASLVGNESSAVVLVDVESKKITNTFNSNMKDNAGCGIKVLRTDRKGDFGLYIALSGKLYLLKNK